MIFDGGLMPINNTFLAYIQFISTNKCFQIDVNGRILNEYDLGEEVAAKSGNKALIVSGGVSGTAYVIDNLSSYLKTGVKSVVGSVAITSRGIDSANGLAYISTRSKYSSDFLATTSNLGTTITIDFFSQQKKIGVDGSLLLEPLSSPYKWKISTDNGATFNEVVELANGDAWGAIYDSNHYLFMTYPARQVDFYGAAGVRSKVLWGDTFYGFGWVDASRGAFAVGMGGTFRVYLFDYDSDTLTLLLSTTDHAGYTNQRVSYSSGYLFVQNNHIIEIISLTSAHRATVDLSTVFGSTASSYGRLYVNSFFN
jgi:hypothetical protein